MSILRISLLTTLAMIAFAANSILCRFALKQTTIDPASFTIIRLVSGALVLGTIAWLLRHRRTGEGNWRSALALFGYAAGFSFAYTQLSAATGALLLFGAVQVTMISHGLWVGEHLHRLQRIGLVLAFGGLIGLLLPGLAAPPLLSATLMLGAGIAWGIYSIRGKGAGDPTCVTAGNFIRAALLASVLSPLFYATQNLDPTGVRYAILSGALTSGLGYAIWYSVVPALKATYAATIQLSVPVITALGGILLLGEPITPRLILASLAILGGIGLVILGRQNFIRHTVTPRP